MQIFRPDPDPDQKPPGGILAHMKKVTGEGWYLSHDHSWTPEKPPTGKTGNAGRFIFSRYPILWEYDGISRFNAALIDLPGSVSDRDVLVINVHYSNHNQAEKTGKFLADVAAGKIAKVPSNVMIMVCGDFNNQEGQARYQDVFNSIPRQIDLRPTHLGWRKPNHTTIGSTIFDADLKPVDIYTKKGEDGKKLRKRIDFMFWRSDRLEVKHAHILNPMIMDRTALKTYGLKKVDTALNPAAGIKANTRADHWPYFADFVAPDGRGADPDAKRGSR